MSNAMFVCNGCSNHSVTGNRQEHDYYATEPLAVAELLKVENFDKNIYECACGEGHISEVLKQAGYNVTSTDLIDRGYGIGGVDFLKYDQPFFGDIITNPPYKYAKEFVEKALEIIPTGNKVAMFLKLTFLESTKRGKLLDTNPPKKVWVARKRLTCVKNGNFDAYNSSAVCYAWFVWEKGFKGETTIGYINKKTRAGE